MNMPPVTIYSTPTCHYCDLAKKFFTEHGVSFENKDVTSDPVAREEMVAKSNQMGVPVIMLGDTMVVGFNKGALQQWVDTHKQ